MSHSTRSWFLVPGWSAAGWAQGQSSSPCQPAEQRAGGRQLTLLTVSSENLSVIEVQVVLLPRPERGFVELSESAVLNPQFIGIFDVNMDLTVV